MRYQFDKTGWVEVEPARVTEQSLYAVIDAEGHMIGPGYPTLEAAEMILGLFDTEARYSVVPLLS